MADNPTMDQRAIDLLVQQGLVTEPQAARLRAAVKRGMALGEAVVKTPLVDPVKLASIQSMAVQSLTAPPPQQPVRPRIPDLPPAEPLADDDLDLEVDLVDDRQPVEIGGKPFRIQDRGPVGSIPDDLDLDLDAESRIETAGPANPLPRIPALDSEAETLGRGDIDALDDLDLEFPEPAPLPTEEREEFKEQVDSLIDEAFDTKSKPRIVKPSHGTPAPPMPSYASRTFDTMTDPGEYRDAKRQVQTYDLADDEGINLIRQVNDILLRAVEAAAAGVQILADPVPNNVRLYDTNGRIAGEETVDADNIEKVVNRLKVMARIEVWRRLPVQKGSMRLRRGAEVWDCYVKSEIGGEKKETVTAYLEKP